MLRYESGALLREHELRVSSCFPIVRAHASGASHHPLTLLIPQEKETKNYYISDLTRAHTLEYQSHSAFIVALEFARNVFACFLPRRACIIFHAPFTALRRRTTVIN